MIFAYQILRLTNYCNLRCSYCDWQKEYGFSLNKQQLETAKRNINWTRSFADNEFGDFLMAVFSGGEPFLFPELIEMVLEAYSDKWVRISTNGLFNRDICLPILSQHRRLILTASLDGFDMEGNRARFQNQKELDTVKRNIYEALRCGITMMILCTINRFNIDSFFEFADELYKEFRPYIDRGQLVMPAHYITGYTTTIGIPSLEQEMRFVQKMEEQILENPIFSNALWHYKALIEYVRTKKHPSCRVEQWSRCAHFLGDQMIDAGIMHSYICPMRGYGDMGEFNTHLPIYDFQEKYNILYKEVYKNERCSCFVDWTAFDSVLYGETDIEDAQKWFDFFRDRKVMDWIKHFKEKI